MTKSIIAQKETARKGKEKIHSSWDCIKYGYIMGNVLVLFFLFHALEVQKYKEKDEKNQASDLSYGEIIQKIAQNNV